MKFYKRVLSIGILCLCFVCPYPAQAAEIEVLRGEEEEIEVYLQGSEEVYSLFGTLHADTGFVLLKDTEEGNTSFYQAAECVADGNSERILLSSYGSGNYGLYLRIRVEGKRIGQSVLTFSDFRMTGEAGNWLERSTLPGLTVNVLPNPLHVYVTGTQGNDGWYTGKVQVTVEDKDAAWIQYDTGNGMQEYTGPFQLSDGSWQLTVTSDDGYGYKKEENESIHIDTIKPSLTVSEQTMDWQSEAVVLTASASDYGSGLSWTGWTFSADRENSGGLAYLGEEKQLTLEEDGIWYLHLSGTDYAGNEKAVVYGPYKKDSVAPEVSIENIEEGQLVEETILPETVSSDDRSGIKSITYYLDGETWSPGEIRGKGQHTLTVTVEDMAGNAATDRVSFAIYDPVDITVEAEDTRYTGEGRFQATVSYDGKPLAGREAEFFLNGESIGSKTTDRHGRVWLQIPIELAPQEAVLTVRTAQEDENHLLAGEGSTVFTVAPENAWLHAGVTPVAEYGDAVSVYLETGEIPDLRMGDITRAEVSVALYLIEKDGSKTPVDEILLHPEEDGRAVCDFYPEPGLYEIVTEFTENSCYTGQKQKLRVAVYEIRVSLDMEGGSLLLDLPQFGTYIEAELVFSPEFDLNVTTELRIPGTGITLTENRLTDYTLTTDGLLLSGTAVNPKDRTAYSYEVRIAYSLGGFLDEVEISLWKGTDKSAEPVYHYEWPEADSTEPEDTTDSEE